MYIVYIEKLVLFDSLLHSLVLLHPEYGIGNYSRTTILIEFGAFYRTTIAKFYTQNLIHHFHEFNWHIDGLSPVLVKLVCYVGRFTLWFSEHWLLLNSILESGYFKYWRIFCRAKNVSVYRLIFQLEVA